MERRIQNIYMKLKFYELFEKGLIDLICCYKNDEGKKVKVYQYGDLVFSNIDDYDSIYSILMSGN